MLTSNITTKMRCKHVGEIRMENEKIIAVYEFHTAHDGLTRLLKRDTDFKCMELQCKKSVG